MFEGVNLYYEGICVNSEGIKTNVDIDAYIENHDFFSMTFEGEFYEQMNFNSNSNIIEGFKNILLKHGYTYRQYDTWSITLCKKK
jgi:replication initiation and membrane attachment protein DnaB